MARGHPGPSAISSAEHGPAAGYPGDSDQGGPSLSTGLSAHWPGGVHSGLGEGSAWYIPTALSNSHASADHSQSAQRARLAGSVDSGRVTCRYQPRTEPLGPTNIYKPPHPVTVHGGRSNSGITLSWAEILEGDPLSRYSTEQRKSQTHDLYN